MGRQAAISLCRIGKRLLGPARTDLTENQNHAITSRLTTAKRESMMPNAALDVTAKGVCSRAPMRPFREMTMAMRKAPRKVASNPCHHVRPRATKEEIWDQVPALIRSENQ